MGNGWALVPAFRKIVKTGEIDFCNWVFVRLYSCNLPARLYRVTRPRVYIHGTRLYAFIVQLYLLPLGHLVKAYLFLQFVV